MSNNIFLEKDFNKIVDDKNYLQLAEKNFKRLELQISTKDSKYRSVNIPNPNSLII